MKKELKSKLIQNHIAKFASVFFLTIVVIFIGVNHFNTVKINKQEAEILADRIPLESLLVNSSGIGQINFRGMLIDVKREISQNSPDFVRKSIENANFASGSVKININSNLPPDMRTKLDGDIEFMLFSEKGKLLRGYLLNGISGITRITSVEISLNELKKAVNPHSGIDANDIPSEFMAIMPLVPELYIKNDTKTGRGIYSCRGGKNDKNRLIELAKQKMVRNGWKIEDWTLPLEEMERTSNFFLSATKDGTLCHVLAVENNDELHLTYRFSGARHATIDDKEEYL